MPSKATTLAVLFSAALAAPALLAADITPGTYMLEGGSYTIDVRANGDGILVVEPNKESPYTRFDEDEFHFWNDNTQTNYGMRFVDDRTILAFKPDVPGNTGSRLVLVGGSGPAAVVENGDSARWEEMALEYLALSESDPANAQAWVACGAVAMQRAVSTVAEADAYAQEMSAMLQMMMPAGSASPCADVFEF